VTDILLHLCSKHDHSILTGDWRFCFIYAVKMTQSPVNIECSFLPHKCSINISHLIILNWSFLMHKCYKNRWLTFLLHFYSKKDQFNIIRWQNFLLHSCSLFSKKDQLNINRWLTFQKRQSPVNIEQSFLLHKCNQNVSHLLILNGNF
jgi:hypothetical protein